MKRYKSIEYDRSAINDRSYSEDLVDASRMQAYDEPCFIGMIAPKAFCEVLY